ncbi:MAG: hypothetical protein LC802_22745 [Acidobacteria bacterium]|nr:hypothetical protein [Acidobacteriota bacterium]
MSSLRILDALTPRAMMKAAFEVMQLSAETFRLLTPGQDGRVAWQEFRNKLQAYDLFGHVDFTLRLPEGVELPLAELVARASALETYRAVWATEGVGHYFAENRRRKEGALRGLLGEENTRGLPPHCLIALHTGMGLSLAECALSSANARGSDSDVQPVLRRFDTLCRDNSREGYTGATFEALGLVARNLYPHMIPAIDGHLRTLGEELLGYFWHGVGRGIYFAPTNFLPFGSSPWWAVKMTEEEPPHELGRLNALSGLAFALTLVNIREPEILEAFLRHHGDRLSAGGAILNGITSSLVVWCASTRDDPYLAWLSQHRPARRAPGVSELWETWVSRACEDARRRFYPALTEHRALGEVFRYQSLPGLLERLGREPRAGAFAGGAARAR